MFCTLPWQTTLWAQCGPDDLYLLWPQEETHHKAVKYICAFPQKSGQPLLKPLQERLCGWEWKAFSVVRGESSPVWLRWRPYGHQSCLNRSLHKTWQNEEENGGWRREWSWSCVRSEELLGITEKGSVIPQTWIIMWLICETITLLCLWPSPSLCYAEVVWEVSCFQFFFPELWWKLYITGNLGLCTNKHMYSFQYPLLYSTHHLESRQGILSHSSLQEWQKRQHENITTRKQKEKPTGLHHVLFWSAVFCGSSNSPFKGKMETTATTR